MIASIIFVCVCLPAFPQCTPGQSIQLQETWKKFVVATATEDPKSVAPFFNFPIRLLGYFDGDKPTIISKQFFLKNYKLMFINNQLPGNSDLHAKFELVKKFSDAKILEESKQRNCAGMNGSLPMISIGVFRLYWNANTGWLIHDIYYSHIDKENLFDAIKHPLKESD